MRIFELQCNNRVTMLPSYTLSLLPAFRLLNRTEFCKRSTLFESECQSYYQDVKLNVIIPGPLSNLHVGDIQHRGHVGEPTFNFNSLTFLSAETSLYRNCQVRMKLNIKLTQRPDCHVNISNWIIHNKRSGLGVYLIF